MISVASLWLIRHQKLDLVFVTSHALLGHVDIGSILIVVLAVVSVYGRKKRGNARSAKLIQVRTHGNCD